MAKEITFEKGGAAYVDLIKKGAMSIEINQGDDHPLAAMLLVSGSSINHEYIKCRYYYLKGQTWHGGHHTNIPSINIDVLNRVLGEVSVSRKNLKFYLGDEEVPESVAKGYLDRLLSSNEVKQVFQPKTAFPNRPDPIHTTIDLRDFPSRAEEAKNDPINPNHYKSYSVETIDMMIAIYGKENVAIHCELTAFKYRMRAGKKGDYAECIAKEQWYLDKAKGLRG